MTLAALKEVLQDRVNALVEEFEPMTEIPSREQSRWQAGYLEGRLEEARVCLRLVERLQLEEAISAEGRVRRADTSDDWGKQQRGDWPRSSFGSPAAVECVDPNDLNAGATTLTIARN